mmetsp:Transcript_110251/g.311026  ORF Transcript_110251/g.311026 Transcript_110251/m.311026 type:complete len:538 (-) Transcript_110251:183-1796(-)
MSGFGDRISQRQKNFKKGIDEDESRRKREDAAVQLRKQVRDEALQKKRFTDESGQPIDSAMGSGLGAPQAQAASSTISNLPELTQMLASADPQAQFNATQQFRKILSVENNPPIQEVIQSGVVPQIVQFLKEVSKPDLQFEAAWVLTNIASGSADQTKVVVDQGALPVLVNLLQSTNDDVREQAVWALGNIAGDSPNFRDLVLQSGGLVPIMTVLRESEKTSMMRNATWTLSNLCRGKPPPPLEWVSPALGILSQLIQSTDCEILTDACWALSYLSDGTNDRIGAVIGANICPRIVELLGHTSPLVQTPALRVMGNIATGDDVQTQALLHCGALPALTTLLSHTKKTIRKETCWTISNITAGNREQIQAVADCGLFPPVINLLQTADFDIKKEAAWAISNAMAGGSPQQIEFLVGCGCVKPLADLLSVTDTKIVGVALDALENILKAGKLSQEEKGLPDNPCCALIEQADGLQKIEALQEDPNEEIYWKAMRLLENYFPLEDDKEDLADDTASGGKFSFGGAEVPKGGFNFGTNPAP